MSHIFEEQETLWYYYIPDLSRESWDGIQYESIRYDWDELDYRFGVDYPQVPEPAAAGLLMGLAFLTVIVYRQIIK